MKKPKRERKDLRQTRAEVIREYQNNTSDPAEQARLKKELRKLEGPCGVLTIAFLGLLPGIGIALEQAFS